MGCYYNFTNYTFKQTIESQTKHIEFHPSGKISLDKPRLFAEIIVGEFVVKSPKGRCERQSTLHRQKTIPTSYPCQS